MKNSLNWLSLWLNKKNSTLIILGIIGIFYSVGILGHGLPTIFGLMISMTPGFLTVFAFFVLFLSIVQDSLRTPVKPQLIWILVAYLITFTLEAVGVATGLIFGAYSYGESLGPRLFETPLIIGLNWVIVILGITVAIRKFSSNSLVVSTTVGFLAVGFDFVLEPLAIDPRMDYWTWEGVVIPLHNYVAWFVISFVFSFSYAKFVKNPLKSFLLPGYWIIQMTFFLAIRLFVLEV
ncbi:MAG: carotenoid biosynthesis protein [Spirochaetales bacterium]|nr:carotenoid biosynthesis protein [Spirochaetales bacterium]